MYDGGDMRPLVLRAARAITPDETLEPAAVVVSGERIEAVGVDVTPPVGAEVVELAGLTLAPGFVDLHVHGGGGFSLATTDPAEVEGYSAWAPRHGVTSFLAGIVGASPGDVRRLIGAALAAETPGAELLGLNLEGPFVNPGRRGALPEGWTAAPKRGLLEEMLAAAGGRLRLMTVAPELEGALDLIQLAADSGVRVSIGHSDAGYEEALAGFRAGASHVTHLFNGMRSFHHRETGIPGAAFDSAGVTVEVIADGVHLHPALVRMLFASFGAGRIALVTDAVAPAGLGEGVFRLGGQEARPAEGRVTLADGTIAGSAAVMEEVVANVVGWGAASLADAIRSASTVPAAVAGAGGRKGRLAAGYNADIIGLSPEFRVDAAWVRGRCVYGPMVS